MVSNRRGPKNNCGCCAPPCTCIIAKASFSGTYSTFTITGPSTSVANPCNSSGSAVIGTGSPVANTIDFGSDVCGDSWGGFSCGSPGISHFFRNGYASTPLLLGRNAGCGLTAQAPGGVGLCPTNDLEIDAPCTFNIQPSQYMPIAQWGGGVSWYCDGGTLGTPEFAIWVSATYELIPATFPSAPSGWTRTDGPSLPGGFKWVQYDISGTSLRFDLFRYPYIFPFCNNTPALNGGFTVNGYRASVFTSAAPGATTVTIPTLPYDPFSIMNVTATLS